jgi:hypothetical protein
MMNLILAAFDNLTPMNWEVIKPALNFLWQGLLAIFIVIGLIIVAVKITATAINKAEASKMLRDQTEDNENS